MLNNLVRTQAQERIERRAKLAAQEKKIQMQKLSKHTLLSRAKLSSKLQRDLGIPNAEQAPDALGNMLKQKLLLY